MEKMADDSRCQPVSLRGACRHRFGCVDGADPALWGSDQAGYELKQVVMRHLEERGLSYKDYGSYSPDPVDYPVYGKKVAHAIVDGEFG